MNQVGDLKTFRVLGTPPVYPDPIYVWKFWDGQAMATGTESGSIQKRLNLGGNPAEGGGPPFVVPYRCDICDQLGNVVQVITSTIAVNNPPTVVGAPTITPNNQAFPFQTQIVLNAYDLENGGLDFYWYYGTTPVGGGVKSGPVNVAGTYYGTLPGLTRDLYTDTFNATVYGSGTVLTCKIVDGNGGTTSINVPVQGYDPGSPQFSVAAQPESLTTDASTLPTHIIAPGQNVQFSVYAADETPGELAFMWYFYGSNGWSSTRVTTGTVIPMERGARSDYLRSIAFETPGVRTAVVSVTNLATGRSVYSSIPVTLVANQAPEMDSVGIYNVDGEQITEIVKDALPQRTIVKFSGTATDADMDIVFFKWAFTAPAAPTTFTLYGRDAYVDVSDWPGSSSGIDYATLGVVTATDKYGVESSTFAIPQLTIKT